MHKTRTQQAKLVAKAVLTLSLGAAAQGCTFNFEVTSQRTALENQVMGSYRELEDDLILVSSVRGKKQANKTKEAMPLVKQRALDARQNQQFNQDDIDELKNQEILGETASGGLALLPSGIGHGQGDTAAVRLAQALVVEENRDRETIWKQIIEGNTNLSAKDLPAVRQTYAKLQREQTRPGQWFQEGSGAWRRQPGAEGAK